MNLILIEPADLLTGTTRARLNGRRLRYAREVHRAAPGDRLRVGLLNGRVGFGTVVQMDGDALELDVAFEEPPPPPLPVTVLLALPRPKTLKRLLQGLTTMGVKRIFLMNAWRVEKSYWQSPALQDAAVREQLVLGLEQARDTRLPSVELRRRFKPFIEDEIAAVTAGESALVAHPDAGEPCPRHLTSPLTLAIGPEGGFIQYEVDLLKAHGFMPVSLGPRRLRVEQAVAALLGRV
jgi:RsmE family RNA methyltransferase